MKKKEIVNLLFLNHIQDSEILVQDKILISIIVPIYNVEKYLNQCVDSLLAQTYENIEIILVDDGGTDNSGKICDDYAEKDSRVKAIHKKNGGLSDARNVGIREAKGEYIGFVDSDDWIDPDMYELLVCSIIKAKADISVCGYYREYIDNSVQYSKCKTGVYSRYDAVLKLLNNVEIQDHAWTKLYRKNLWDNIEYPVGKYYEDILTTYKLFLASEKIAVVDKCLYHYRQRSGSIARDGFNDKRIEWLNAVENLKGDYRLAQEYKEVVEMRILKVMCCLLREIFVYGNKETLKQYEEVGRRFFYQIRRNRKAILDKEIFSKSLKFIALLSILGYSAVVVVFQSKPMKKYISNSFKNYV